MKKKIAIISSIAFIILVCLITFLTLRSTLKTTYTSADAKMVLSPQGEISFRIDGKERTYKATKIKEEMLEADEFYKYGDSGLFRYKVVVYKLQDKVIVYKYSLKS